MATRERPGDRDAANAQELLATARRKITDGERTASIEGESRLDDVQLVSRRVELKVRDDPDAGVVILLLNRTAHNRRILAAHREALRGQFPLDGAAVARALRQGRVPAASGILLR